MFSPFLGFLGWGAGGGRGNGAGAHNLLMRFSSLGSSKMEISETDFFYILSIQNDQISYIKHVLDPLSGVFTLFGCFFCGGGGGGGLLKCNFPLSAAQK